MIEEFISEIDKYLAKHEMNPTDFGRSFANDPSFVFRLKEGREPRISTMDRVRKKMSENQVLSEA